MSDRHRPTVPIARIALVAALVLAGCSSSPPQRTDGYYRLEPQPLVTPTGTPAPSVLLVKDVSARGFLGGREIVFRTREEPLLTQRYDDLLWEDPPTQSLTKALVTALRAAKVFRFVVVPAEGARADYLLGGELQRFEHRPTDAPPRVAATLHLALVQADSRRTLASRDYRGEEVVDGATPNAMVAAFTQLGARLIGDAVRNLQAHQPPFQGTARP